MIVDSGLQHIADQMSDQSQTAMGQMAVGTGTNAEASNQTALQTEIARVALTSKTRSDKKAVYVGDFAAGIGTGALTEVGLLNAVSAGVMLSRIVFPVKNKGPSDTLKITIEHTYARG
jgi:fumarate hydratase class II